jgi:hypothetical protein
MNWLKQIFCRHKWDQRAWLGRDEAGYLYLKCGRIEYRKVSQ